MRIDEIMAQPEGTVFRPKGWQAASDAVAALTRPGFFYRGMTDQEYQKTIKTGAGIASNGSYSVSGEGTSFAADAGTAESVINYGRDDPRRTGRSTYLVEVRASDGFRLDRDGYYKAAITIPQSQIARIWEMRGEDEQVIGYQIYP